MPKYSGARASAPSSATSGSSAPLRDEACPAFADRLELAVAVQLIAKQVAQDDHTGAQLGRDAGEPELVDFEQPELARQGATVSVRGEQGRGDTARHVCAGEVVNRRDPGLSEDRAGERGGGRLAVGRGNHNAATR
jgi:hypothetical protein